MNCLTRRGLNQYAKYFPKEQSATLYVQPLADYGFTAVFNLTEFIEDALSAFLTGSKRYDRFRALLALAKGKNIQVIAAGFYSRKL